MQKSLFWQQEAKEGQRIPADNNKVHSTGRATCKMSIKCSSVLSEKQMCRDPLWPCCNATGVLVLFSFLFWALGNDNRKKSETKQAARSCSTTAAIMEFYDLNEFRAFLAFVCGPVPERTVSKVRCSFYSNLFGYAPARYLLGCSWHPNDEWVSPLATKYWVAVEEGILLWAVFCSLSL